MTADRTDAFAKVNLCLLLGTIRGDGRHELVTLFESVSLADELLIVAREPGEPDEVVCDSVTGPNLVAQALDALRAAGWAAPPVKVEIHKRIPIAAGMGGGSADAAALLRHAPSLAPVAERVRWEIAVALGADVPAQLEPGPSLGTGGGEIVAPVVVADHGLLILPQPFGLSTAEVYREADRLGLPRPAEELAALGAELRATLGDPGSGRLPDRLMINDLQPAALSLRPELTRTLALARSAGADLEMVCGSGPTVIGIFPGADGFDRATEAAERLGDLHPRAKAARPVRRGTGGEAPND